MRNKHAGGAWEKDAGKVLLRVGREIANLIEQEGKTMEAKHTPGPWGVEYENRIEYGPIVAGLGFLIAEVSYDPSETGTPQEWKANARLIAAAPDLLAAVEHLIHYAEKLESAADLGKETGNITLDKYRELVAKAKGSPC